MKPLKQKWNVPTWTLVAVGLLLNVFSALMTNFYIDDATRQANALIQEQQQNEKLISLTWQQIETVERKRELILVILSTSDAVGSVLHRVIATQVARDLTYWFPSAERPLELSIDNAPAVMTLLDNAQQGLRDKINALYLDNLELIETYGKKMSSISRLRNLALFLQIIGLALVLARDLNRRDYSQ